MPKTVFISYSHHQGKWVWDRLVPCLKAGGAQVVIDQERFKAGRGIVAQMDEHQDDADLSVLVLSPEYLESDYCVHEMKRALQRDPRFENGRVIPIVRRTCDVPARIRKALYVDLCNDRKVGPWRLLLEA